MEKLRKAIINTFLESFIFLALSSTFYGKTFKIISDSNLPVVYIDIPITWSREAKQKENGTLTTFRQNDVDPKVFIEIRTFKTKEEKKISSLVNAKAARLSAQFSQIDLIKKKSSTINKNTYYTLWKLKQGYKFYIEQSIILKNQLELTIVSCRTPEKQFEKYKVICDNALLSTKMFVLYVPPKSNENNKVIQTTTNKKKEKSLFH